MSEIPKASGALGFISGYTPDAFTGRMAVLGYICGAVLDGKSSVRVRREWMSTELVVELVNAGYKIDTGWFIAYEPGYIISWK